MPNTTIASLPYPALLDAPNGPLQIENLARAIEPRLVNSFKSVADRNLAVQFPVAGMVTYRADVGLYEYWNGTAWVGAFQGEAIQARNGVASGTDVTLKTTESAAQGTTAVSLTNPSSIYKMTWIALATSTATWSWNTQGIVVYTRLYFKVDTAQTAGSPVDYYEFTGPGTSAQRNFTFPMRSGTLTPGSKVTCTAYMTMRRSSGGGVATFAYGAADMTMLGVPSK